MSTATLSGPWAAVTTIAAASDRLTRAAGRQADAAREHSAAARELRAELSAMRALSTRPPASDPVSAGAPLRVLLVEDHPQVRSTTTRALERAGYVVRAVATGWEGCQQLTECPDIVVCDLALGEGCTGFAVAREARLRCPGARVVLWTGELAGLALDDARRKCGAHDVAHKPDVQDLLAAMRGVEVSRGR